ncbi:MAG TPA: tetratricopeptide repeat protein, partial [Bryobacteraceae bacterium]
PALAKDLKRLAYSYSAQHKFSEAEPLFATALAMVKRALGSRHPWIVRGLRDLAKTYREQARFSETRDLLAVSIAILEKAAGRNHPETETALEFYSEMLRVLNLDARKA